MSHTARLRAGALILVLPVFVACLRNDGPESSGDRATAATVEETALRDIARQRAISRADMRAGDLVVSPETSRVVPRLVVYRAVYRPAGSAHMESVALIARLDSSVSILHSAEEFARLVPANSINSERQAIDLCAEITRVVGRGNRALNPPILNEGSGNEPSLQPPGQKFGGHRVALPTARRDSSGTWQVALWMTEPGQLTQYQCQLGNGTVPRVAVTDSIAGGTVLPDKP